MSQREKLLSQIEAFLKRTGMPHTRFGKLAANDPALVGRLRAGGDVTTAMSDRLRLFMADYKRPPPRDGASRLCPA